MRRNDGREGTKGTTEKGAAVGRAGGDAWGERVRGCE